MDPKTHPKPKSSNKVKLSLAKRIARKLYRLFLSDFVDSQIIEHLTVRPIIYGGPSERVHIDDTASIQNCLINVSSGNVRIEKNVFCGHNVSLLTGTHDIRLTGNRRQGTWPQEGRDIVVREGVWLASNCTILGPAEIGAHAVVAAGAVVRGNVQPRTLVAGVPARLVRHLERDRGQS